MADMIDQLESLPELVETDGPTPQEIRDRARHRTRRRRILLGVPVVLALVIAGVLAVTTPWNEGRPGPQLVTGDAPEGSVTTPVPSEPTTTPAKLPPSMAPSGLTAVPVLDLDDGDEITVTFDDPTKAEAADFMAVCAGELIDQAFMTMARGAELMQWCGPPVTDVSDLTEIAVQRMIDTPDGVVDCAANVGRCVVAALLDEPAAGSAAVWSPIGFRAVRQPDPTVAVSGSGPVEDGTTVTVSGEGGLAGQAMFIRQCRSPDGGAKREVIDCDTVRGTEAPVGDDGHYKVEFRVFSELLTYSNDGAVPALWVPCEPCFLVVSRSNGTGETVSTPIEVTRSAAAIRPVVTIVEPGPYKPGQRVTLQGTGFQMWSPVQGGSHPPDVQVCSADLMSKPYDHGCGGGVAPNSVSLGDGGEFTVTDFELPGPGFITADGTNCAVPNACALGTTPGEGIAYLLSGPLDLSG